MADLLERTGIDGDVFAAACAVAAGKGQQLVGHILAVDSFPVFKRMMVARNT